MMTNSRHPRFRIHRRWAARVLAACVLLAMRGDARPAWAHEGHAALPSSGASIDGDQLLLSNSAIKAVDLKLHTVAIGNIRQRLRVNAHVQLPPLRRAKVATLLSGRVREIHVKPGAVVTRGEPLASIESLELESLQVELLKAETELTLLTRLAKQQRELADTGAIRGDISLATESKLRRKRAEFEIARRKLTGWGLDAESIDKLLKSGTTVDALTLTSPMAGVVEQVTARTGQLVQSTDHLFEIVDRSTVYLVGEVLEADAHLVQRGAAVTVAFAGLPGEPFTGKINHQHLHLHRPQRAIHVVVPVSNSDGRLRPGMFGRMTITVAEAKNEIVCPSSVLIETGSGSFVLRRVDEGKFKRQPVEIGMRSRTQVVIKSGLFPGQQVISRGTYLLASMFDGHELLKGNRRSEVGGERSAFSGQRSAIEKRRAESGKRVFPQPSTLNHQPSTHAALSTHQTRLAAARAVVEIPVGKRAFATSLIEGWIVEIPSDAKQPLYEGVSVKKGQLLARVRSPKLRSLQLELLQANADLKWTQDEVKRLRPVAGIGGVAAKDLWQREAEEKLLLTRMASLKRQLAMIGLSPEDLKGLLSFDLSGRSNSRGSQADPIVDSIAVRAPMAGRISRFSVSLGELVHAHDKLFEIQDTGDVWIKAFYFERDAGKIAVGQDAVVTFPANPSLRVQGQVVRLAPQLASKERVLPVWIEIRNPGHFLKEGMLAEVVVSESKVEESKVESRRNPDGTVR